MPAPQSAPQSGEVTCQRKVFRGTMFEQEAERCRLKPEIAVPTCRQNNEEARDMDLLVEPRAPKRRLVAKPRPHSSKAPAIYPLWHPGRAQSDSSQGIFTQKTELNPDPLFLNEWASELSKAKQSPSVRVYVRSSTVMSKEPDNT